MQMGKVRAAGVLQRFICTLAMSALPFICNAGAGWTDLGQVSNLNQQPAIGAAPGAVVLNVSTTVNPSGCSVANAYYLSVTDDRTTRLFTMLMMAQATGRSVQLWVTGTCNVWGYAQLDGLIVQ
jgi:hypothetical protein